MTRKKPPSGRTVRGTRVAPCSNFRMAVFRVRTLGGDRSQGFPDFVCGALNLCCKTLFQRKKRIRRADRRLFHPAGINMAFAKPGLGDVAPDLAQQIAGPDTGLPDGGPPLNAATPAMAFLLCTPRGREGRGVDPCARWLRTSGRNRQRIVFRRQSNAADRATAGSHRFRTLGTPAARRGGGLPARRGRDRHSLSRR